MNIEDKGLAIQEKMLTQIIIDNGLNMLKIGQTRLEISLTT